MIFEPPLDVFYEEVIRWNKSFNLVSRVDPESRVTALIEECWNSGHVVADYLVREASGRVLTYLDLGSGGGFPGLIWHSVLSHGFEGVCDYRGCCLVEPREKRAWFLDQAARKMQLSRCSVSPIRWEPGCRPGPDIPHADIVLISLKALALDDAQVLGGLASFMPSFRGDCVIARLAPWGDGLDWHPQEPQGNKPNEGPASCLLCPHESAPSTVMVSRHRLG